MPLDGEIERAMTGVGGVRKVAARWVITGELVLDSAAHLGNGESSEIVDMPLLRDRAEGRPLLTGASLAGALRSHLNDVELGFQVEERRKASALFGGQRGDVEGVQSPLIVFDALGLIPDRAFAETRDGVAIDPSSGTASEHLKFDLEVLPAGTVFPIRFELLVADTRQEKLDLQSLASALLGLERGEIRVGARRSRGLGACHARRWRARRFDLGSSQGWLQWLASDHGDPLGQLTTHVSLIAALRSADPGLPVESVVGDKRDMLQVDANLQIRGGLLVRSPGLTADSSDNAHLRSSGRPVLPGTSVAGALRARALRIARMVRASQGDAEAWVNDLFGPRKHDNPSVQFRPKASRLRVSERPIANSQQLRQARIRIDRFTSGVVDGALFDEEPDFQGKIQLHLELRNPRTGEPGLLLLLLKDLLTGDLALGGSSSVGRGVVTGTAEIQIKRGQASYRLDPGGKADTQTVQELNRLVSNFATAEKRSETT